MEEIKTKKAKIKRKIDELEELKKVIEESLFYYIEEYGKLIKEEIEEKDEQRKISK